MAKTMEEANHYIKMSGIKEWGTTVPGGSEINWAETQKALEWMNKYAYCAGCEQGGGSPDCAIRICANEKGIGLCNECSELDKCEKFNWLGDPTALKAKLMENKGKSKLEIAEEALEQAQ
jgi:hypothetical protein